MVAAAAAIAESKLALNFPTHSNAQDHAESHTLASHSSKGHDELENVLSSQHHVKYTNAEAVAAVEAKANLNIGHLYPKATGQTIGKSAVDKWNRVYLDNAGWLVFGDSNDCSIFRDAANKLKTLDDWQCVVLRANSLIVSGAAITATPVEINTVCDELKVQATKYCVLGNSSFNVAADGGSIMRMPASDDNASIACIIQIPNSWNGTTGNLKVSYQMSVASTVYSVVWKVGATAVGETLSLNVLDNDTTHDFAGMATNTLGVNTVPITRIAAGDELGVRIQSDALNGTICYIRNVWLEPS